MRRVLARPLIHLASLAFVATLAALAPAHADVGADSGTCEQKAIGVDAFCKVNGARLHYIDWGGKGPPLILLAGFGDTARAFDGLAPHLTPKRHVYAFTRRGFGLSQQTPENYDAATFGADVVAMMDGLKIPRADLAGHSIAGAELAMVARGNPNRVRRLVYLDAAYDRSDALTLEAGDPAHRAPTAADLASLEALTRWRASALGVPASAIQANVRQSFDWNGTRLVPRAGPGVMGAIVAGGLLKVPPDYEAISAPSLALYAPKDQPEQLPVTTTAAERQASVAYGLRRIRPWMLREQARFLETAPCGVALEAPAATHFMHLQHPAWAARTMLEFLDATSPCDWTPSAPVRIP